MPRLILFALFFRTAQADTIYDAFIEINVYCGTVQLFSPSGTLLSTSTAMTVDTEGGSDVSFRQGCVSQDFFLGQEEADGGSAYLKLAGDLGFTDTVAV
jgi:hypothetical protein